jgi:(S)-citramalyl-CoA lyase
MSSKLLVIGGQKEAIAPALASGAGSVCLDLEDTVPDDMKDATRKLVPGFLGAKHPNACKLGVRLSPLSNRDGLVDILMVLGLDILPDFFILTKVESAAEVLIVNELLGGRHARIPFNVIIETPKALASVDDIARASPRIESLSFGGKDLSKALRMARTWEPMLYARSRVVNAAASAGIGVFDEPFHPRDDLDGLRENCRRVRALGFTGKSTTDVRHPVVINEVFSSDSAG